MDREESIDISEYEAPYPDIPQNAICERYAMSALAFEEMVAFAIEFLGKIPIYGTRIQLPENGNASGFIHCGEHRAAPNFYQPLHVHQLNEMLPQVLKYLCLATGAKFVIDPQGYEDV